MPEDSFYWWLAGIVDGEGSITTGDKLYSKTVKKTGYTFSQRAFALQIVNTDLEMLKYVKDNMEAGFISIVKPGSTTLKFTCVCYNYQLVDRRKLLEVAKILLPKLRQAKKTPKMFVTDCKS